MGDSSKTTAGSLHEFVDENGVSNRHKSLLNIRKRHIEKAVERIRSDLIRVARILGAMPGTEASNGPDGYSISAELFGWRTPGVSRQRTESTK